jgi:hypothetical protein
MPGFTGGIAAPIGLYHGTCVPPYDSGALIITLECVPWLQQTVIRLIRKHN